MSYCYLGLPINKNELFYVTNRKLTVIIIFGLNDLSWQQCWCHHKPEARSNGCFYHGHVSIKPKIHGDSLSQGDGLRLPLATAQAIYNVINLENYYYKGFCVPLSCGSRVQTKVNHIKRALNKIHYKLFELKKR